MNKKLKCSKCGNDKVWKNINVTKDGNTAVCGTCDHVEKSKGGFVVDKVIGDLNFNL